MSKHLRILGWSLLTVALVVSLILGGFQWGMAQYKTPDFAQSTIGDTINLPILRIGNPLYASTAVDYTIDGTRDDIQFQAAIDALPATGGILQVVSSGTISFGATVSRAINNVTIVGTGPGTYFTYDASTPIFSIGSQSGWIIRDCRFDAGSVTYASATKYTLDIMVGVIPLKVTDANTTVSNLTASGLTLNQTVFATTNGLLVSRSVSGATFPTTPISGEVFLHTPTGRKILYQWDGTTWQAIQSYGTMTLYVAAAGTDDLTHGTATGADALKTLAGLKTLIGTLALGGSVNVYFAAETFSGDFSLSGMNMNGYRISLYGTLTPITTDAAGGNLTASGNGVKGAGAALPAFVDNLPLTANAYNNKILHLTKVGGSTVDVYRIIDVNTTTTITLAGQTLSAQPVSGDTATVLDWGTTFSGTIAVSNNQSNVYLYGLKLTGQLQSSYHATVRTEYCSLTSLYVDMYSKIWYFNCYLYGSFASYLSEISINGGKLSSAGVLGIISAMSFGYISGGTVIDTCYRAVDVLDKSFLNMSPNDVYNVVKNVTASALTANGGGSIGGTANNQYSANGANETGNVTSYSYID